VIELKVLLDTNVLIRITDVRTEMPNQYAEMMRLIQQLHYDVVYHPAQLEDFGRDTDVNRRQINLSRIKQYVQIENPPAVLASDEMRYSWSANNANQKVDNALLFSVLRGYANILITEDQGIHAKARRADLSDVVWSVGSFLEYLRPKLQVEQDIQIPSAKINTEFIRDIDLRLPFFDSLRNGYPEFDTWYRTSAANGRKAWVVYGEQKEILALCIYKIERDEPISDDGYVLDGKVLKLCTFKVAGTGEKLGERLLDAAFKYALMSQCRYAYVQVRKGEHDSLVKLLTTFGFHDKGMHNLDVSYVKRMFKPSDVYHSMSSQTNLDNDIEMFPHVLDGGCIKKFLVPIRPLYHSMLFPDSLAQDLLFSQEGIKFTGESNAIRKAYICKSKTAKISPADMLFFYRTEDRQNVDCVGIVEKAKRIVDPDQMIAIVSKRSVYRDDTIREMVAGGGALVVMFRLICYLCKPVNRVALEQNGLKGEIQSIRELPYPIYRDLFRPQLADLVVRNEWHI